MLPVSGFSDCSWAECDADKGRSTTSMNVLDHANLLLEGYFRVLYVPLGGSKTRMEKITFESMKFYFSMFSDKPPCIPFCFGIVDRRCNHTARGGRGLFIFHIFFLSLCSNGFFYTFSLSLCKTSENLKFSKSKK